MERSGNRRAIVAAAALVALGPLVDRARAAGEAGGPPCVKPLYGAANGLLQGVAPSSFYIIDPLTGDATLIGPIGFDNVTGLAFAPDGRLYATANGDALFNDGLKHSILITIDEETGAGTLVGEVSNEDAGGGRMPDITFRSGVLFAYGDLPSGGTEGLYTIDPAGTPPLGTFVGASGFIGGGNGLAAAADGTLYATPFDDNCLVTLDPATGAGTCVPGSSGNVPSRVNALAFHPDTAELFGSYNDAVASALVTIDVATGAITSEVPTVTGLDAIIILDLPPDDCRWDLNDNGVASFPDLLIMLSTWGPCAGTCGPGDLDCDGEIGFLDLIDLLSNWGPCPKP